MIVGASGKTKKRCSFPAFLGITTLLLALLPLSCVPPGLNEEDESTKRVSIDLKDPVTRQLAEWQDLRLTDSLLPYLEHDNPSYRYFVASALGSYSEPVAEPILVELLEDPVDLVRSAAAYALGQQQPASETRAELLVASFRLDSTNRRRASFSQLLQAIGKQAGEERLRQIATVPNYAVSDTNLLEGTAWSLFYFGRRGLTVAEGTERAVELSRPTYPTTVRYPALAYLSRYADPLDSTTITPFLSELDREPNADLRMLMASTIAKSGLRSATPQLLRQLKNDPDWRVRINLLRGLGRAPYAQVKEALMAYLTDDNALVAQQAADQLIRQGVSEDATTYWKMGRDSSLSWPVRYKLYQAANQHLPIFFSDYRGSINYQLQERFRNTEDTYQRVAILEALAAFPWNYRIISELGFGSDRPAVRTAAIRALATISQREDFDAFFRSSNRRVRIELSQYFQGAIQSGDVGMIYEAAQVLSAADNPYQTNFPYPNLQWAKTALGELPLPEAVESYRALENAINVLEGRPVRSEYPAPEFSRPIDWQVMESAGDAPVVRIHTNKGNIDVRLWPELAPGTVSNLLRLSQDQFFNDKPFHRVVPNFVVQGGDPRGDGYGSVDFSIRTETPPFHWDRAGIIGMASAGRDTESIQFFITHSGTPHLDGNYTAFGELIEGQEIVDALRVGDVIERVEIR